MDKEKMNKEKLEIVIREILDSVGGLTLLWHIVLATGGIFLLFFVVQNGFLPDLDLSGALMLLASVALVSVFLVFILFVLTTAGGVTIYLWFSDIDKETRGKEAGIVAMLSAALIFALIVAIEAVESNGIEHWAWWAWTITALASLGAFILYMKTPSYSHRYENIWWIRIFGFLLGGLFSFFQAMVFTQFYIQPQEDTSYFLHLWGIGAWLVLQAICMGIVASRDNMIDILKLIFPVGIAALILLLTLSNNPAVLTKRMAQMLGIGALENVSLIVTHAGCEILNTASKEQLCNIDTDQTAYLSNPVTLLSRLGSQMKIRRRLNDVQEKSSENNMYTIIIPSREVLGWREEVKVKRTISQKNTSPN